MNICYLTGKEIKKRGSSFPEGEWESKEHIIPNAIGGNIASNTILTHKANQELNLAIDIPFTKMFESYAVRLNFKRDRNTTPSASAVHASYDAGVVIKGDRYYPKKPFYDPEKNAIYADSIKTGENYINHLIKIGAISDGSSVKVFDDLAGEFFIEFKLDNKIFKQGIAKMAAGFASMHKVPRRNLRNVINFSAEMINDQITLASALPSVQEELELENSIHNSTHYPAHCLVLCGSKENKILYCYVELFSTFQWYVLLDDKYDGEDIYATYAYDLMGGFEIDYCRYISSVPAGLNYLEKYGDYRRLSKDEFLAQEWVDREKLKLFNHLKFHRLSAFVNYTYLERKAKSLGLLE